MTKKTQKLNMLKRAWAKLRRKGVANQKPAHPYAYRFYTPQQKLLNQMTNWQRHHLHKAGVSVNAFSIEALQDLANKQHYKKARA